MSVWQTDRLWPKYLFALGAFLAPFTLFLTTLSGDIGFRDSSGFIYRSFHLGALHPTGYPLELLLGKGITFLPFADIPTRVNLLSAIFGALACLMMSYSLLHILKNWYLALLGGSILGTGQTFWSQAIQAEVYTLNAFFLMLVFYLWLRTREEDAPKFFLWFCFVFGLGLCNHLTLILTLPAFTLAFLAERERLEIPFSRVVMGIGAFLAPLSLYLFTLYFLKQPGDSMFSGANWGRLWTTVSGSQFHHLVFGIPLSRLPDRMGLYLYFLIRDYTPLLVLGALGGLIAAAVRYPGILAVLSLGLMALLSFNLTYAVADIEVFFIPTYCLVVIALIILFALIIEGSNLLNPYVKWVPYILFGVAPLYLALTHYAIVDAKNSRQGRDFVLEMTSNLPFGSTYAYSPEWEWVWSLRYMAEVEDWWSGKVHFVENNLNTLQKIFGKSPIFVDALFPEIRNHFLMKKVRGENVSAALTHFVDSLPTGWIVLVAEKNQWERHLSDAASTALQSLGIPRAATSETRESLLAVGVKGASENSAHYETTKAFTSYDRRKRQIIAATADSSPASFSLQVGAYDMGNFARIFVDGVDYSANRPGLNVVVLDPVVGSVNYSRNFDTSVREQWVVYQLTAQIKEGRIVPPEDFSAQEAHIYNADFRRITSASPEDSAFFLYGWGERESFGRWVVGREAGIAVQFDDPQPKRLIVSARPFRVADTTQIMEVRLNGHKLGTMEMQDTMEWQAQEFPFPQEWVVEPLNLFSFHFSYAAAPASHGSSQDTRELAAGVQFFQFGAAQ